MEWNGLEVIYRSLYRVLGPHFPGQPFTRVPRWPIIGHLYPRQWPLDAIMIESKLYKQNQIEQ